MQFYPPNLIEAELTLLFEGIMKNQYPCFFLLLALIIYPVAVFSSSSNCLETIEQKKKPIPIIGRLAGDSSTLEKKRRESNAKMLKKEATTIAFNKRLIAATKKEIGNYLVYIAEIQNIANGISLFIEIENNTNTKYLDGSDILVNSFFYTDDIGGEYFGKSARWTLKDSFGNLLKGSAGTPSLAQQIAPHTCQKVSGYYQVLPIRGADLIVYFPRKIFGVEEKITIPAKMIKEVFYPNP